MRTLNGNTLETTRGTFIDLTDPKPEDIHLDDIATALANTCRFGGLVSRYYSVAEHACLVSRLVKEAGQPPLMQLVALHHDSHEAYVGDIPTPLKALLEEEYRPITKRLDQAIAQEYLLPFAWFKHSAIKSADELALRMEGRVLKLSQAADGNHWPWTEPISHEFPWEPGWWPEWAAQQFKLRHHQLVAAC